MMVLIGFLLDFSIFFLGIYAQTFAVRVAISPVIVHSLVAKELSKLYLYLCQIIQLLEVTRRSIV